MRMYGCRSRAALIKMNFENLQRDESDSSTSSAGSEFIHMNPGSLPPKSRSGSTSQFPTFLPRDASPAIIDVHRLLRAGSNVSVMDRDRTSSKGPAEYLWSQHRRRIVRRLSGPTREEMTLSDGLRAAAFEKQTRIKLEPQHALVQVLEATSIVMTWCDVVRTVNIKLAVQTQKLGEEGAGTSTAMCELPRPMMARWITLTDGGQGIGFDDGKPPLPKPGTAAGRWSRKARNYLLLLPSFLSQRRKETVASYSRPLPRTFIDSHVRFHGLLRQCFNLRMAVTSVPKRTVNWVRGSSSRRRRWRYERWRRA
ncbi:hypothetical protein GALMADRAFT_933036 [Galerina marginata CBS 339.88]|uniref:Uncharacterized protein n=1 Tax=Galerina marginata (strain CBS 339.88) TaxID=685588 RepID=A0A067SDS1_GALM3|nr:hypothetical protein GALMADRAFT_933036 [Galerina marginata CBS 339.88]